MKAYAEVHPSSAAAFVIHSKAHALRLSPDGRVAGAEVDEVPCALTVMTAAAITTSSLENIEDFFFWSGYLVVRVRRRGASGTIFMGFLYSYEIQ
jgi:hypothetical protein